MSKSFLFLAVFSLGYLANDLAAFLGAQFVQPANAQERSLEDVFYHPMFKSRVLNIVPRYCSAIGGEVQCQRAAF